MSDILIKNMGMPEKQVYVILNPNGLVEVLDANNVLLEEYQAVPVPPHGRCIDADSKSFPTLHRNPSNDYMKGWNACLRSVQQQPTIIPAKEGEA